MTWEQLLTQLADWLDSRRLLTPDATWVIGVSGGADSTLLLHAMPALSQQRDLTWTLHAAHFHHGLRGAEADADEVFVRGLAERLNVTMHTEREDIPGRVRDEGGTTEEVARRHRYRFLERVALRTGGECVAVAHHADDNVETVLQRICRGTGLRGLSGISEIRPIQPGSRVRLIRPLLQQRRADIEALCAAQGFETRSDSTNLTSEFTRGRIRNQILPLLRETINPNVSEALMRLSEQARWFSGYLEEAAARTFEALLVSAPNEHPTIKITEMLLRHRVIQSEVIRRAVTEVAGGEQDLTFGHIEAVLKLANAPASGKELHLPGRVIARKQYERLEFRPATPEEPAPEIPPILVNCPGATALPMLNAELVAEICDVDAPKIEELRQHAKPGEEWLDYDQLHPPLVVRGRRDGDRFQPLGAPGAKSLGDFLSNEKIEPAMRARTGVLCDREGPVWVMPLRIAERAKLTDQSRRAVRLVFRVNGPRPAGSR